MIYVKNDGIHKHTLILLREPNRGSTGTYNLQECDVTVEKKVWESPDNQETSVYRQMYWHTYSPRTQESRHEKIHTRYLCIKDTHNVACVQTQRKHSPNKLPTTCWRRVVKLLGTILWQMRMQRLEPLGNCARRGRGTVSEWEHINLVLWQAHHVSNCIFMVTSMSKTGDEIQSSFLRPPQTCMHPLTIIRPCLLKHTNTKITNFMLWTFWFLSCAETGD